MAFLPGKKAAGRCRRAMAREYHILRAQLRLFRDNNSLTTAGGLSFTTLLSLIPLLAVVFMVLRAVTGGGMRIHEALKPFIYRFLNPGTGDQLSAWLDDVLRSATVDTLGILGCVFLLFSVYSILAATESALNRIWGVPAARRALHQLRAYGLLVFVLPVLAAAGLTLWSALLPAATPPFLRFLLVDSLPLVFLYLLFLLLMKGMPNRPVPAGPALCGALQATLLTLLSRWAFFHYTGLAVSTNALYGSLAVLPFLMLWIYSVWAIVLFAACGVRARVENGPVS